MEVIICTPNHSGLLVKDLCQNLASVAGPKGSTRGQGDEQKNKSNLRRLLTKVHFERSEKIETKKTKSYYSNKTINLKTLCSPAWVGGFISLSLCLSLFVVAPSAYAADLSLAGVAKIMANVSPTVNQVSLANELIEDTTVAPEAQADDFIAKPIVAETTITPVSRVLAYSVPRGYVQTAGPHYFPYGYCTYYVSQKRTVTWRGNASAWLATATAVGEPTGKTPEPGAIMVTSEGGRTGHVAYVEAVSGDSVTISEMNYKGFGIVSTRTISGNAGFIRGYIY